MEIGERRYLGDGVYAEWDGYHVVLTANSIDFVYLDSHVLEALLDFAFEIANRNKPNQEDDDELG